MITSLTNQKVVLWTKLKKKKYRDEYKLFLIEGEHLVQEAIKAGIVKTVISTEEYDYKDVERVSSQVMKKLAFTKTPQPVMAVCHMIDYFLIDGKRYLLLDHVQDPGNIGTMIRTALSFGFDEVILSGDSVDIYNDKLLRSTQGAIFHIPVISEDLHTIIPRLKEKGVTIIGTSLENASSIDKIDAKSKMAFIMGNEGQGMHIDILEMCDQSLYIPIDSMESLNVSIAAGIIMYTYRGHSNG